MKNSQEQITAPLDEFKWTRLLSLVHAESPARPDTFSSILRMSFGLLVAVCLLLFADRISAQTVVITNLVVTNGIGSVVVNSALNKIYLSSDVNNVSGLVEVDGNTFSQTVLDSGVAGWGVDVDVTNNNYWSCGLYAGTVTAWSAANAELTSISLGYCPGSVSIDAPHRRVWIGAQCGGGDDPVFAIDADTFAVQAGPLGSHGIMNTIQVNPGTGRFYFSTCCFPSATSERVNPSAFTVTTNSFGVVIGVNASSNLLYATADNHTLQIINGAPDPEIVLTNVPMPFSFSQLAVNPDLNRVYVGSANSNLIAVLDGRSGKTLETIQLGSNILSVGSLSVDPARNRLYVMGNGTATNYLYVIEDSPLPTLGIAPAGNQTVLYWPAWATNYVLQSTTNLASPNWANVTNGMSIIGVTVTNTSSASYFRLVQQ